MSLSRLNSSSSSLISLSSFDTIPSFNNNQVISYHNNTNNNKNYFNEKQPVDTKSFDQTINQAVEYFEQILDQCATPSNTPLTQKLDQQERTNDIKSKVEVKKRYCEDFLRSLNKKQNFEIKQREQKIDCRKWCEEQNRRLAKYNDQMDDNDSTYYSKNRNTYGSTFYCRKALLQKPDGTTYIGIRKRFY
jgi:hypothetical protein